MRNYAKSNYILLNMMDHSYNYSFIYSFIRSTMALQLFAGPWPLLQFRNLFTQTVGLLGRVISPLQGRYLHTGQHKHRIKAHTDIHALSGIRTHDPSVRANEDSSCLRPCGPCDRDVEQLLTAYNRSTHVLLSHSTLKIPY
jgi:hypothetical protein